MNWRADEVTVYTYAMVLEFEKEKPTKILKSHMLLALHNIGYHYYSTVFFIINIVTAYQFVFE